MSRDTDDEDICTGLNEIGDIEDEYRTQYQPPTTRMCLGANCQGCDEH